VNEDLSHAFGQLVAIEAVIGFLLIHHAHLKPVLDQEIETAIANTLATRADQHFLDGIEQAKATMYRLIQQQTPPATT
jgi:hypothetical protein